MFSVEMDRSHRHPPPNTYDHLGNRVDLRNSNPHHLMATSGSPETFSISHFGNHHMNSALCADLYKHHHHHHHHHHQQQQQQQQQLSASNHVTVSNQLSSSSMMGVSMNPQCAENSRVPAKRKNPVGVPSDSNHVTDMPNSGSIPLTFSRNHGIPNPNEPPEGGFTRVCILGGGFGGLYTALRLDSLLWVDNKKPQVVLIDKSENFVFKPMLYELLSGEVEPWEIAPSFKDLLANTGVRFVKDKVKRIQPSDSFRSSESGNASSGGNVQLESGITIEYDWLVLALGAEAKLDLVPGAAEYALPFSTLDDALKVDLSLKMLERAQFGKNSSPIHVAVVGCGYSGVELAATISERLQDRGIVQGINVDTNICPTAPPGNREAALKVLSARNIQLFLGYYVNCVKKSYGTDDSQKTLESTDEVVTDTRDNHWKFVLVLQPAERGLESKTIEADLILWTVGSKSLLPQLESYNHGNRLPLNSRGQAEIDDTLQVKGHPRIFAVGDSAALRDSSGRLLPATAQVAFQQADFAGWNIWASINNRPLLPFRFQNLGEMMTLGTDAAAVTPSFIEGLTLDGPVGHAARKFAYLIRLPTDEHRVKVGISWLAKSAVDSIASVQSGIFKALFSS